MDPFIDPNVLKNFKSRILMRLNLLRAKVTDLEQQRLEFQLFIKSLPKELKSVAEIQDGIGSFEQINAIQSDEVERFIVEVEGLTGNISWHQLYELQEHYFGCVSKLDEQTLSLQEAMANLQQLISVRVLKKLHSMQRALNSKKVPDIPPERIYSTPTLDAMFAAVGKFWLQYDPEQPPTQKQISYFIAEQLGESDKSRMTDELARAIKPLDVK